MINPWPLINALLYAAIVAGVILTLLKKWK